MVHQTLLGHRERQRDRQTDRDTETDRQAGRQIETDRQTDRQTEKERELDKFYFTIIYLLFHPHTLRPRPYLTRIVIDNAL